MEHDFCVVAAANVNNNFIFQTTLKCTFGDMNAALDWGNTRVKLGLFEDETLRHTEEVETHRPDVVKILSDRLSEASPVHIIWTASGEISEAARQLLDDMKAVAFNHQTPVRHQTSYTTRNTLGPDRILLMEAAAHEFPGTHVLVIDMGTCITYDLLDASGTHRGGSISPGWRMRLKAMHDQTARLPLADAGRPDLIGTDTTTALQSGAYHGMKNEMQETIRRYEERYRNLHVILTGGDAQAFDLQAKKAIFARPNYTLVGLNAILLYHAQ